jgi:DNA polymerase-3 subunit gamma/tau
VSYQVFARKYRPLTFDDVLGQDHVVRTLKNAIEQNRLAHAYLFVGPRGTGKTSTARIFAKALNCTGGPKVNFDPNEDVCQEIADGRSMDVLEIDGASNRGIDNIRDICNNLQFAPTRGLFRIVYIDEVHMLTKESFNALLKTLEEPPKHVKFIFATTEPNKILPTILSRCQRFDLRPIPTEIIAKNLIRICGNEGVSLTQEAAFAIAKTADGGMRDALSMLDQLVSFCGNNIDESHVLDIFGITSREQVASALQLILERNIPSLLQLVQNQAEAGRDMGQFLSDVISLVREALISKVDSKVSMSSVPENMQEHMMKLISQTKSDKILRLVEILTETEDKMRWTKQKRLNLEMGLIKSVHAMAEISISDIIKAMSGAPVEYTDLDVRCSAAPSASTVEPIQNVIAPSSPEKPSEVPPAPTQGLPASAPVSESPSPNPIGNGPVSDPTQALASAEISHASAEMTPEPPKLTNPSEVWTNVLSQFSEMKSIQAMFLKNTMCLSYDNSIFTVGYNPMDIGARDALNKPDNQKALESCLSSTLGSTVRLTSKESNLVPLPIEPVREEPQPTPAVATPQPAEPAPKEEEAPQKEQADESSQQSGAEKSEQVDEYYTDPLIEDALEILKGRIVS